MRIEGTDDLCQLLTSRTNGQRLRLRFRKEVLHELSELQGLIKAGVFSVDSATQVRIINVLMHHGWKICPDRTFIVTPIWSHEDRTQAFLVSTALANGLEEAEFV